MRLRLAFVVAALVSLAGCLGPPALRDSVLGYDETVNALNQDILLLNLARLSRDRPPHFTVTSSIAATFNFETSGGIGGDLQEGSGTDVLSLSLGARAAENPTFSIVPVTRQEFTQRILTPVGEDVLAFFLFQGVRIELLSRLMADGIEILRPEGRGRQFLSNRVTAPEEYQAFRRIVLHLGALQQSGRLFIQELTYDQPVLERLSAPPSTGDVVTALGNGLAWTQDANTFTLTRSVRGRVLISNYDPLSLGDAERKRLNEIAAARPDNMVLIDVRPDHPGGEFPIFAALKLRSLFAMLDFVAKGIDLFPEFPVEADPRTGPAVEKVRNPVRTLDVSVRKAPPAAPDGWIRYQGRYYALGDSRWDRAAFLVLYELFQVTVTDVSRVGIPITIAK